MVNEKRLIDARRYEESILLTMRCWNISPCLSPEEARKAVENLRTALNILKDEPTVDAVEVVRCKDCKWYKEGKLLAPNKFCFRLKHPTENRSVGYNFCEDDFCSYGERKDNVSITD